MFGAFLPNPVFQAFDSAGDFLNGGWLYSYQAGTADTAKILYHDSELTVEWTNPIELNARGEPKTGGGIFGDGLYKFVLKNAEYETIWTIDYVPLWGIRSIIQQILAANTAIEIINILGVNNHEHNTDFKPPETPDGSRTGFSTARKFIAGSLEVWENGVLGLNGGDYIEDADKRGYNFNGYAPRETAIIQHRYLVDLTA